MSGRPPKRKPIPPGASLLDMMASGDGFGSVPPEDVPAPLAGSFGELFAKVEEDRTQVRKNLDDARPYLEGIKSRNDSKAEKLERKGHAIVEVWKSSGGNLTFAQAVRLAETQIGFLPGSDDPYDINVTKRGRTALARIGMKWVRGKGPKKSR